MQMFRRKKAVLLTSLSFILIVAGIIVFMNSCSHSPYVMPASMRTTDPNICFERDVLPIFVSNCAMSGCHAGGNRDGGYNFNSYQEIMRRGIVPGNAAASKVWEAIAMNIFGVSHMPKGRADLSTDQLNVIRRWIETGALDSGACSVTNCDTTQFTYSGTIAPMMHLYCVGCHNSPSAQGGSLADYNSVVAAVNGGKLVGNISHLPGYNAMPAAGLKLSDCQITQVKEWIAAGMPDN